MMSDSGSQWEFTLFYSGQNESLRSINLSWNGFSDKGSKAISSALCKNSTLMEIDLSSNRITKEGIVYLTKAFSRNTTLEILKVVFVVLISKLAMLTLNVYCEPPNSN